jgi:hypothetical protein
MAKAFIGNVECRVTVDKDLGDSWAIAVVPPAPTRKGETPLAPRIVKLQGEDRARVTKGALEILKQRGEIDRYELEPGDLPPPPAPPATPPAGGSPPPASP